MPRKQRRRATRSRKRLERQQRAQIRVRRRAAARRLRRRPARYARCVCSSAGSGHRLRLEPRGMAFRPGLLGRREAAAVAQEKLREPMARAEEIGADIFATPEQIARGFFLLGRNMNRRQRAGPIQHGELAGIAPIGLDAIARATRDQGRRDDLTRRSWRAVRDRCNSNPHGPGFVTALHRPAPPQPLDEPPNRRHVRRQRCAAPASAARATRPPPPSWPRADRTR